MALTINLTGVEPAFAKNTAFNKNFGTPFSLNRTSLFDRIFIFFSSQNSTYRYREVIFTTNPR